MHVPCTYLSLANKDKVAPFHERAHIYREYNIASKSGNGRKNRETKAYIWSIGACV